MMTSVVGLAHIYTHTHSLFLFICLCFFFLYLLPNIQVLFYFYCGPLLPFLHISLSFLRSYVQLGKEGRSHFDSHDNCSIPKSYVEFICHCHVLIEILSAILHVQILSLAGTSNGENILSLFNLTARHTATCIYVYIIQYIGTYIYTHARGCYVCACGFY